MENAEPNKFENRINIEIIWWKRLLPIFQWMTLYKKEHLKSDTIAGITLASFVLPTGMAYADLAGLPPETGIYCCLACGLVFAFFTTSRQLVVGPTSSISLLVGSTLAVLSGGDAVKWLTMASLTALGVGLISILAYIIRLSSLVNFISDTVLTGFKTGAALSIMSTILPDFLDIPPGGSNFLERILHASSHLPETNITVLIFGLVAFVLFGFGEKIFPGRPTSFLIVTAAILLMALTGLGDLGIKAVGAIPEGLPDLHFPMLGAGEMSTIIDLAFACFILGYIEGISVARSLASDHNYEIDSRQELLAMGMVNAGAALVGGYPVSGGLSQSAINDKAGAKTPFALIICSLALALLLLFFAGLLNYLPKVLLSAIVLNSVLGLFKYKELKKLYVLNKQEFVIAIVAVGGVVLFGILKGVMIAAMLSLLMLLQKASKPNIAILGRIRNTNRFSDIQRHPENVLIPSILILRIESALFYFNAQYIRDYILQLIQKQPSPIRLLVLDLSSAPWVDVSGSKMLVDLSKILNGNGIDFRIVEAHATVRDILRKQGIEEEIGHISRKTTIPDVVDAFLYRSKNETNT